MIRCSYYQLYQENRLPTVIHDLLNPRLKDLDVVEDPLVVAVPMDMLTCVQGMPAVRVLGKLEGIASSQRVEATRQIVTNMNDVYAILHKGASMCRVVVK